MADTRIDELRRRLERDPGSRLFAQLAEELRKSGELAEAIRVARGGLALHPSYPSARLTLGRALLDSGDATAARAELESALADAPDNILASRFLAQAREQLGDLAGAAEQYQRTLRMSPGDRQLQAALQAVEARLAAAPAAVAEGGLETTPPRRAPPPLPAFAATLELPVTPAREPGPRPPVPTVPPSPPPPAPPPRPAAAVAPPAEPAAPADAAADELPATLRIRPSQVQALQVEPAPTPTLPPATPAVEVPSPAAVAAPAPAVPAPAVPAPAAPAPAAPAPAPAQPAGADEGETASGTTAPFPSATLAELYFQQGLVERAKDVYQQLVGLDPGNDRARQRLRELEQPLATADERAARRRALERTIAGLEAMLAAVRSR